MRSFSGRSKGSRDLLQWAVGLKLQRTPSNAVDGVRTRAKAQRECYLTLKYVTRPFCTVYEILPLAHMKYGLRHCI